MNVEYTVYEKFYPTTSQWKINHFCGWHVGMVTCDDGRSTSRVWPTTLQSAKHGVNSHRLAHIDQSSVICGVSSRRCARNVYL